AIGEPGAEKILLLTGRHPLPALESNGVRVLQRLGKAPQEGGYAAVYKQAQKALAPLVGQGCEALLRAHDLLRRHGQSVCKRTRPECAACVLAKACPSAALFRGGKGGSPRSKDGCQQTQRPGDAVAEPTSTGTLNSPCGVWHWIRPPTAKSADW